MKTVTVSKQRKKPSNLEKLHSLSQLLHIFLISFNYVNGPLLQLPQLNLWKISSVQLQFNSVVCVFLSFLTLLLALKFYTTDKNDMGKIQIHSTHISNVSSMCANHWLINHRLV